MHRQITVTEPKPGLAANRAETFHTIPGLVGPTPPTFGITQSCKGVKNRIDVRRDVQTEMLEVVSGIDDSCHAGAKASLEAEYKLGATDAAALRSIYSEIDRLEKARHVAESYQTYIDVFPLVVVAGLGLLLLEVLLINTRLCTVP